MNRLGPAAATAFAVLLALVTPAAAAPTDLDPGVLPRGADLMRPYVEGETIVDGTRVVDVPASRLTLRGVVRGGYLVTKRRFDAGLTFIGHDGTQRRLPGADEDAVLSPDGRLYTEAFLLSDGETRVGVRRIRDGKRLASHVFRSWVDTNIGRFASPVDLDGKRMLIGGSGGRVLVWNWQHDRLRTVKYDRWHLHTGSLDEGIAAGWTAPGQRCTVVAPLSRPGRVLWRSCRQRVLSFSPGGRRMVTIDRRTSPGSGRVQQIVMRKVGGTVLGRWSAEGFTDVVWETDRRISFRVTGATQTSMVRCSASQCANASDPVPLS